MFFHNIKVLSQEDVKQVYKACFDEPNVEVPFDSNKVVEGLSLLREVPIVYNGEAVGYCYSLKMTEDGEIEADGFISRREELPARCVFDRIEVPADSLVEEEIANLSQSEDGQILPKKEKKFLIGALWLAQQEESQEEGD